MTFVYPLGFLALLAVPVLIFIYIIKNRYTEQTITSTYLWTLSERFLRRRIPINKITGLLSLILQILAVLLIAIIVAHPVLSIPGGARDYCFVLDASGSMNIEQDGSTRFEEGKKEIAKLIEDSMYGSTYTLIYSGDSAGTMFESYTDKDISLKILDGLEVSYTASNLNNALSIAQRYFDEHPSTETYLVTDKTFENTENVKVINVLKGTENYGISDVDYFYTGGMLRIEGKVTSYASDARLTLNVDIAGVDGTDENVYTSFSPITVNVKKGEETEFYGDYDVADFSSFKVTIAQNDSLAMDNEVVIYNVDHENIAPTLLVYGPTTNTESGEPQYSEEPPYLFRAALRAAGNNDIRWTTDVGYKNYDTTGIGLYIFYNCVPTEMPRDGAVWFINPTANIDGSNFTFNGSQIAGTDASYNTDSKTAVQDMLEGLSKQDFGIYRYVKLGVSNSFVKYITCDGNPILFTGTNIYGNREVVFAFDLADSAPFTLSYDCTTLLERLLSYSFPEVVETTSFYCGDTLQVNIIEGCVGLRIDTPLGNSSYPDTSTAISEYALTEVGIYTIHLTMRDGKERDVNVYSSLPKAERALSVSEAEFVISGTPGDGRLPGIIDNLLIVFIILAVIAVADYGVYCYEQYQLR